MTNKAAPGSALLALLTYIEHCLQQGDAEAAVPLMEKAVALCVPGTPALPEPAASEARAALARCMAAEQQLRARLNESMNALGASSRARDAYGR